VKRESWWIRQRLHSSQSLPREGRLALDATQVADPGDTADLVTAVATEGVSQDGEAERFLAEVLDADGDVLAVLVAAGVESPRWAVLLGVLGAARDLGVPVGLRRSTR